MQISRISVWQLKLPLSEPYWLSGGRLRFDELDSTFVRIETSNGLAGWGEACPWGHTYLPASGPNARASIAVLAPALIGQNPLALGDINRLMDVTLPGHFYAKSPIDIACWDILGQYAGLPLWQLMGAKTPAPIALNSSISTGSPEEMVALIEKASTKGYRVHSAKLGGADVTTDIERIEAITSALGPDESVTFDINRAWTPAVAIQVLNSVSSREWVEQPCETLDQCLHVKQRVPQPILLDECLHSYMDHVAAWKLGACEGFKLKPNRVGGLSKALQIRDFALQVGWRMHIEDVGGSALADTAAFHIAASTPDENRMASWLAHAHLSVDPVPDQGVRNLDGWSHVPDLPGLGVTPDEAILGEPMAIFEAE